MRCVRQGKNRIHLRALSTVLVLLSPFALVLGRTAAQGNAPAPAQADKKPDPELVLSAGEMRLEGRVTAITGPNAFTMQATAFTTPTGNHREFDEPKEKKVLAADTVIVRGPDAPRRYKFSNVKLGEPVAIIGKGADGGLLQARVIVLLDVVRTSTVREVMVSKPVADLGKAGMVAFHAGQMERAISLLRQAASVAVDSSDRAGEALTESNLALVLNQNKQPQDALKVLARALQVSRQLEDAGGQSLEFLNMAQAQLLLSNQPEAIHDMEQALDAARLANEPKLLLIPLQGLADMLDGNGAKAEDLARAAALYSEAIPLAREVQNGTAETDMTIKLALVRLRQGKTEDARTLTAQVEASLPSITDNAQRAGLLETLGLVYTRNLLGDETKSRDFWTQAMQAYTAAGDAAGAERIKRRLAAPAPPPQPVAGDAKAAPAPGEVGGADAANPAGGMPEVTKTEGMVKASFKSG